MLAAVIVILLVVAALAYGLWAVTAGHRRSERAMVEGIAAYHAAKDSV